MRLFILFLLVCLIACADEIELPITFPVVIADKVDDVTRAGVTFYAHVITTEKTDKIIKYGFVWGSQNSVTINGDPGDKFSRFIARDLNLDRDEVKAFVQTSTHTIYSAPVLFLPLANRPPRFETFQPAEGFDGTEVKITFSNYQYHNGDYISIGGSVKCDIISAKDSIMTVRIPPNSLIGLYNFTMFKSSEPTNSIDRFNILGPAIISLPKDTFTPKEKVIITTEYLDKGESFGLFFEDHTGPVYLMPFTVLSSTQIEATIPDLSNTEGRIRLEAKVGGIKKISRSPKNIKIRV